MLSKLPDDGELQQVGQIHVAGLESQPRRHLSYTPQLAHSKRGNIVDGNGVGYLPLPGLCPWMMWRPSRVGPITLCPRTS